MEAEFKREMNRNYLVLPPPDESGNTYTVRMLSENSIAGLLPFYEKRIDKSVRFYYDITSKQPLERVLENRPIRGDELRCLIHNLLAAFKQLERFLLSADQICLEPSFIYVEPDHFQCFLCLIPGLHEDFAKSFCSLSQYLLDHVNQGDKEAVVLAFGIFRQSRKENFGVEDIERELQKAGASDGEEEQEKQERQEKTKGNSGKRDRRPVKESREDVWEKLQTEVQGASAGQHNRPSGCWEPKWKAEPEDCLREAEGKKPRTSGAGRNGWVLKAAGLLLVLVPAVVVLIFGLDGLLRYRWLLGAAELVIAAAAMLFGGTEGISGQSAADRAHEIKQEEFEILFGGESKEEKEALSGFIPEAYDCAEESEEMQTVLLTSHPIYPDSHRLLSINGSEEASVNYFPFLIGKNRDICDFCPSVPGVSRLHAKIEETDSGYVLTDLNSTNGTGLNGRRLQTNESCSLKPGDTIELADAAYRFL